MSRAPAVEARPGGYRLVGGAGAGVRMELGGARSSRGGVVDLRFLALPRPLDAVGFGHALARLAPARVPLVCVNARRPGEGGSEQIALLGTRGAGRDAVAAAASADRCHTELVHAVTVAAGSEAWPAGGAELAWLREAALQTPWLAVLDGAGGGPSDNLWEALPERAGGIWVVAEPVEGAATGTATRAGADSAAGDADPPWRAVAVAFGWGDKDTFEATWDWLVPGWHQPADAAVLRAALVAGDLERAAAGAVAAGAAGRIGGGLPEEGGARLLPASALALYAARR